MAIDVFPDIQTALPAIVDLAQEDIGVALSHLATLEEGVDRDRYQTAFDIHRRAVARLLTETMRGDGQYFALASAGSLHVVDLRDPVICADPERDSARRLSMGSRVTTFGLFGHHETQRGTVQFSALDFTRTAVARAGDIRGMLSHVAHERNGIGTFAGEKAIGFLGRTLGLPIEQVMESRPDYRPLTPRAA